MKFIKFTGALLFTVMSMVMFAEIGGTPLMDKFTEDLSEKEKILLDILHYDQIKNPNADFSSLVEVNGKYPDAYEDAYAAFLDFVAGERMTRRKYNNAIAIAGEALLRALFPNEALDIEASLETEPVYTDKLVSLLIGIDYKGTSSQLENCIHDIEYVMDRFLKPKLSVTDKEMIVMTDFKKGTELYPLKRNILKQFDNFVKRANASKHAYFHYSGHGSYVHDDSGDELDKKDEALCPIDCDYEGFIEDDEIFTTLVKALDSDVKFTAVADCCHSGTIMDLPYKWTSTGKYSFQNRLSEEELSKLPKVVMLSGCKDTQTSSDGGEISDSSKGAGALTAAYLETLKDYNYEITYRQLLTRVRERLSDGGFDQVPQLTSTFKLNLDDYFVKNGTMICP